MSSTKLIFQNAVGVLPVPYIWTSVNPSTAYQSDRLTRQPGAGAVTGTGLSVQVLVASGASASGTRMYTEAGAGEPP